MSDGHATSAEPGTARRWRFFDDRSPRLDRFGPLLALTVLTICTLSLVELDDPDTSAWWRLATLAVGLLIGGTLLLAMQASGVARRWQLASAAFVVLFGILNSVLIVVAVATDTDLSIFESDAPSPIWVALAIATPFAVVRRLIHHHRVTAGTLLGAIAGYLLIALAFSYAFLFVATVDEGDFFVGTSDESTTSFMYFSLVSITTVGYGDLAAATNLGRLLASGEAVIGQVYLVAFVAMLVGLLIQERVAAVRGRE